MVEFISAPVISGFCSAAALTVSSTQMKGLFGLKFKGFSFIVIWRGFFENIEKCNPWDSTLGCSMIVILLLMRVGYVSFLFEVHGSSLNIFWELIRIPIETNFIEKSWSFEKSWLFAQSHDRRKSLVYCYKSQRYCRHRWLFSCLFFRTKRLRTFHSYRSL